MQVMNVHLCRGRRNSIVSRSPFDNPLITAGIVFELGLSLLIVYTASGNATFGTAPIGYPYLENEDLDAVLAFAAKQNDHPVLRSAEVRFLVDAQLPPALARRIAAAGTRASTWRTADA